MRAVSPLSSLRLRSAPFLIAVWAPAKSPFLTDSKRLGVAYAWPVWAKINNKNKDRNIFLAVIIYLRLILKCYR